MGQEELVPLEELLTEQRQVMENLLAEQVKLQEARELQDQESRVLTALSGGEVATVLSFIEAARPEQVERVKDVRGMTLMHVAVRTCNLQVVFALLSKAPELVNVPTFVERTPQRWTPLMVLADKQVDAAFGAVKNQMQAAIVQHMTEAAINCQAGNGSTATHFAASHGDRSLGRSTCLQGTFADHQRHCHLFVFLCRGSLCLSFVRKLLLANISTLLFS